MDFHKASRPAFLNFLRARYEALTGAVLVRSYPYYLGIDPSSICQLRCPHCPTGIENASKKDGARVGVRTRTMLNLELFDTLLDEMGEYLFLIMLYNWGEPLLNKNLPEFIRKARARNIYTEIHSNLSLPLTDLYIEEVLAAGVDEFAGSIDGFSQESYGIYRQGGDFALVRSNLERFIKARERLGLKTRIIWNFLTFSFNEHEIDAVRAWCEDWGIVFNRREAFTDNPDWLPSYRKGELDPPPADAPPAAARPKGPSICPWHYSYSMVNASGSLSPCCAPWEESHDFGALSPGLVSFADIWNNTLYRKSRAAWARKPIKGLDKVDSICLRCPFGEGVQQQYSHLDGDVLNQFWRVADGTDPLLEHAFTLLPDRERFVEYFAKNLLEDFAPTPPDNPTIILPPGVAQPPAGLFGGRLAPLRNAVSRLVRG